MLHMCIVSTLKSPGRCRAALANRRIGLENRLRDDGSKDRGSRGSVVSANLARIRNEKVDAQYRDRACG
jgi:hypothetical protein